jgi:hypothetical protein
MTITRPLRRMTLHLSQIFFTLGLTFTIRLLYLLYFFIACTSLLLVPVNDATSGEIVWTEFYDHTVRWQDANIVLTHLPADVCENHMSICKLNTKHGVR